MEPREYEYICTPTGNELPELFAHLEHLEGLLGRPIQHLGIGKSLFELCRDQNMLPNFRARWCTRMLKIEPTIEYVQSMPKGSVLYVGLRADEEERQGIYGEDIAIDFPLRRWRWGIAHVWRFLMERGIKIPRRTDCAQCFYQRIGEWWNLWKYHPEKFSDGVAIEREIGHTFRTDGRDTWPTALADLAAEFSKGRVPQGAAVNGELFDYQECRVCSL
jgi:3'-phosphoadenosine 5'-phosphosulfate sulfotransferase (PAPS reductase)/FAD synthetase